MPKKTSEAISKEKSINNKDSILEKQVNCLALSSLNGDLSLFESTTGGKIVYKNSSLYGTMVVGDPLCEATNRESVVKEFLSRFPRSTFLQVTRDTAYTLCKIGYCATILGIETEISLSEWSISDSKNRKIRTKISQLRRSGIIIKEITSSPVELTAAAMLSERWMKNIKLNNSELKFLTRPPRFEVERMTRKFAAYQNNQMIGIAFFDTLNPWKDREGYVFQILRYTPEAPRGTSIYLIIQAAEIFGRDNIKILSLGLSPLAKGIKREGIPVNWFLQSLLDIFKFITKSGYNYQGIEDYKRGFHGKEHRVYVCYRSLLPIREWIGIAVMTGLFQKIIEFKGFLKRFSKGM